jgi:hypothetical protein
VEFPRQKFGIQNTDLRYYRDKYVSALFILTMLAAIGAVSDWPSTHTQIVQGIRFLIVAILCIAVYPYRLVAISALLAFAAFRLILGALMFHQSKGLVFGLISGFAAFFLVLARLRLKGDYALPYKIQPYGLGEIVLDVGAFLLMLGLLHEVGTYRI